MRMLKGFVVCWCVSLHVLTMCQYVDSSTGTTAGFIALPQVTVWHRQCTQPSTHTSPRSSSGGVRMALQKAEPLPPTLSAPVFSLATLNDDGTTNMNILTYAVPVSNTQVGIRPIRKWIISLWQGTLTHENFANRRKGVLQLLRRRHVPLVTILGKQSGRLEGVDKKMQCASAGFAWSALLGGALPLLLTDCAAYYVVSFPPSRKYDNAGEHDVALCDLGEVHIQSGEKGIEAERRGGEEEDIVMYTAWLRSQGVIE